MRDVRPAPSRRRSSWLVRIPGRPLRDARRPASGGGPPPPTLGGVSTRMLIILALVCGLAILVAFAVQAAQLI